MWAEAAAEAETSLDFDEAAQQVRLVISAPGRRFDCNRVKADDDVVLHILEGNLDL